MDELRPRIDALRGNRIEAFAASCALNVLSLALPIALLQVYDRVIPHAATYTLATAGFRISARPGSGGESVT